MDVRPGTCRHRTGARALDVLERGLTQGEKLSP